MRIPTVPREQFRATLEALRAHRLDAERMEDAFTVELDDAALALTGKKKPSEKALREARAAVYEPIKAAWDGRVEAWRVEITRLETLRRDIGADLVPLPGDERCLVREVGEYDYGSQGFGAMKYAECSAESIADVCRLYDIRVEVVHAKREALLRVNTYYYSYQVFAHVLEKLDIEIMTYCRGPSLRDIVRTFWARGVNPRVYIPHLEHGFEQREGIDFFGRDLKGRHAPSNDHSRDPFQPGSAGDRASASAAGSAGCRARRGPGRRPPPAP